MASFLCHLIGFVVVFHSLTNICFGEDLLGPPDDDSTRSVRITTILGSPYVAMVSESEATGNDRFEGFIPDLLKLLARIVDFQYELVPVKDGRYGSKNPDGTWNGMIGELIRGEADLAAAPLSVTSQRMRVVDFTQPMMDVHLAILMRKDQSGDVRSLGDLASQTRIKYGVIDGGSTKEFFRTSRIPVYQQMWVAMANDPSSFVRHTDEGVLRVMQSSDDQPFAFITEQHTLRYVASLHCELEVIDAGAYGHYALALPLGSEIYDRIDLALMELRETQQLGILYHKWWQERSFGCHSSDQRP